MNAIRFIILSTKFVRIALIVSKHLFVTYLRFCLKFMTTIVTIIQQKVQCIIHCHPDYIREIN